MSSAAPCRYGGYWRNNVYFLGQKGGNHEESTLDYYGPDPRD